MFWVEKHCPGGKLQSVISQNVSRDFSDVGTSLRSALREVMVMEDHVQFRCHSKIRSIQTRVTSMTRALKTCARKEQL